MELTINREAFYRSLQLIQGITDKRNTIPILSNALLSCHENHVELQATDLEIFIRMIVPANIREAGKTTIPAKKLFEISREIPRDEVSISVDAAHNVTVHADGISFKLRGLAHDEFPALPPMDEGSLVEVDPDVLREMIDKTAYAVSSEDIQYNLTGIFVENIGTTRRMVRFVATDGHRLALVDRDIKFHVTGDHHVIIPRKGILEIKKILQEVGKPARMGLTKNHFIFAASNINLFVRLIDGVFPNYKDVIPKFNQKKVKMDRALFLESLRRASIMSMDKFRGVKLEFQKNGLVVSSSNPDLGESEETVPVEYAGETLQVSFNSRYFIDVLSALSAKTVLLLLNDEMSPAIIKDEQDEDFLGVIMPMRL